MNKPAAAQLLQACDRFLESVSHLKMWRTAHAHLKAGISKAFLAQGAAFLRRFATLQGRFPKLQEASAAYDWEVFFAQASIETMGMFVAALEAGVNEALLAGMVRATTQFDPAMAFNLSNPRAVTYLRQHGAELVTKINQTTKDELRTLIADGEAQGWSYGKMATEIKSKFDGFAGKMPQAHIQDRATLVATTEVGNAYSEGNLIVSQGLEEAGIDQEKSWLTVGDSRVSDLCASNQARGWIPVNQAFPSGHMRPLAHPACRCVALYRSKPTEAVR